MAMIFRDLKPMCLSGRYFSIKNLLHIQETVKTFSGLSRRELAYTICEHLSWRTPRGTAKVQSCLTALEKLEKQNFIQLAPKRSQKIRQAKSIGFSDRTNPGVEVKCSVDEISNLELQIVKEKEGISLWNEYVQRYHYLGYKHPIGNSLRYFIISKNSNQIIGCLMFSSSSWSLADRDQWIGWDEQDRKKRLHLIVNNNRFLLFPWIIVANLASKVFSLISQQIQKDWQEEFAYQPVLLETFVDSGKYSGACYQASNWQCIGKTSGKSQRDRSGKTYNTSVKSIFVYPLKQNFRAALKNEYTKRVRTQMKVDENFLKLWGRVVWTLAEVAHEFDQIWQKRKRVLDSLFLIFLIFRLVFSKNSQGYGTTITDFWHNCHKMKFPLPQNKPISASSFAEARVKLDEDLFRVLNKRVIIAYEEETRNLYQLEGHRIFAVDGSKMNLPRPLKNHGYKTPSDNASYPQGLVSCLYQLKSRIPYDFDLVNHADERKCAFSHLKVLKKNDIVVYDRGYFSYAMLYHHVKQGIFPVFRLQRNLYQEIEIFFQNEQIDQIITITPSKDTSREIKKKFPEIKVVIPLQIRLIKYSIDKTTYVIGTTLMEDKFDIALFKDIYHSRWGIEELYKTSKEFIIVDDFHGKSERGVKQELFAHFVLITINRLCSNESENMISKMMHYNKDKTQSTTKFQVNFKNCLSTVSRHLEEIMFLPIRCVKNVMETLMNSVSRYRQKVRPDRSYPRKSMKPIKKFRSQKTEKNLVVTSAT